MSSREKVYEYMNKCGVLYLATINNNKPKLRPLGFRMMVDGQIYFLTGTFKQVYNQMIRNNNIEFLGHNGSEFIRYYGKVIFDEDEDKSLLKKAFEKMPMLEKTYGADSDLKPAIFHISKACLLYTSNVILLFLKIQLLSSSVPVL